MNKDELLKQKEVLQAELNKLEELIKQEEEPYYYTPKMKEKYFYLDDEGEVYYSFWDNMQKDIRRHEFGNCYKTQGEAINARDIQKDLVRLQRLALTLDKGEKIDWEYIQQNKYYIVYDHYNSCITQTHCLTSQNNIIYCLSDEYMREATKLFGKERLKEILTYQRY